MNVLLVEDDGKDYAIQALPPLTTKGTTVKLGLNAGMEGLYTFNVVSRENFNDTVAIYLEDTYLNTFTNLYYTPEYHFAVEEAGVYNDRFYLHFNNYGVGMEENEFEDGFHIYPYYGNIIIENDNPGENITAMIFDASGKLLISKRLNNNQRTEISLNASTGIYLVKIIGEKQVFTRKVFVK